MQYNCSKIDSKATIRSHQSRTSLTRSKASCFLDHCLPMLKSIGKKQAGSFSTTALQKQIRASNKVKPDQNSKVK